VYRVGALNYLQLERWREGGLWVSKDHANALKKSRKKAPAIVVLYVPLRIILCISNLPSIYILSARVFESAGYRTSVRAGVRSISNSNSQVCELPQTSLRRVFLSSSLFNQSPTPLHNSVLLPSAPIHCAAYIRRWWLMDGDRASRSGCLVKSSITCRRVAPQIERCIAASHPLKQSSLFPPSQRVPPFSKRCSLSLVSIPSIPKMSTKQWADGPYKLLSTPRAALKVKIIQNVQ
jgi:hypothetical protein